MKAKKSFAQIFMAITLVFAMALTGCSAPSEGAPAGNEPDPERGVTGLYTHILTGEDMRDRLVGSWSQVTHLNTLVQYNTLVLTQANTIISADRYELAKDLYNGEMGIHIEARFYGNYTSEGNLVHLETPEFYTWVYYRNGNAMGTSHIYEPVEIETTASDGASFFGDYLDYHGYHRVEPMDVTVNLANSSFTFNLTVDDDAMELGVESESDGFNAGPIFVPYDDDEELISPQTETNDDSQESNA